MITSEEITEIRENIRELSYNIYRMLDMPIEENTTIVTYDGKIKS